MNTLKAMLATALLVGTPNLAGALEFSLPNLTFPEPAPVTRDCGTANTPAATVCPN